MDYEVDLIYEPITEHEALEAVEAWRNDDGTFGTGDEVICIAYKDGSIIALTDSETGEYGKKDIIGVELRTIDEEYAWGGFISAETGKFKPFSVQVISSDGEIIGTKTNTHRYARSTRGRKRSS